MCLTFYLKKEACVTLLHFTWHSLSFAITHRTLTTMDVIYFFSLFITYFTLLEEEKE